MTEQEYTPKYKFNLGKISIREYRELFDKDTTHEQEYEIMAKCIDMTAEEIGDLPQPEFRLLMSDFIKAASKPLDDPN